MTTLHPLRRPLAVAALAALLPLTACNQDNPVANEGEEVVGGNVGADEAVTEDLKITALQLAYPEDGQWEEGEDVPVYAAIANTGSTGDRLVEVRGDDFADAELTGLDGGSGGIEVAENDNVYLEPEGPPSVLLLDLGTSLRSSQSIPVTFVFEEAGEVTLEASVASSPPDRATSRRRRTPPPRTDPSAV
ncbi:copper chaperone PCu(A)C [Blastococcus brunescens]|uniref:Copper chaperone PCu(A)C n=1 Tax=Blastococcus brunescens TaxID=1564165 RepID=A0ABZ1AZY6_9ACTN|nr:copper chaperone PCu(A)C [Blastococcus sp. BMG 8361]WRL64034.1 copper chaperone PCu(A)C [Blastococcus sp. BMG 8361]